MKVRPATPDDCRPVFEWANDPATRAASISSGEIAWDEHAAWFDAKLRDPRALVLIGERDDGEPAGIVRFDIGDDEAEISVNVAPHARGGGTGTALIVEGCRALHAAHPGVPIAAFVKHDNDASRRAFERAGFVAGGEQDVRGLRVLRFLLGRTS